ncbi:MAG TPA: hypothetical protein VI603_13400 [Saprospiraceae bacterium]|nr:hypothetical protein [Saprospiraceae bacterium]
MSKREILNQIHHLPVGDKIWLVEETIKSMQITTTEGMSMAADALIDEYRTNKDLTAFTDIDFDNFYEARRNMADKS